VRIRSLLLPQLGHLEWDIVLSPLDAFEQKRWQYTTLPGVLVTVVGQPSRCVGEVLWAYDAVDHLTEQVGMAVVTGVFLDHMHQHPAH
jgi:hypothetical protein